MTEADINGAIDCIQKAFAEDPYNKWVFNDRANVRESTLLLSPSLPLSLSSFPLSLSLSLSP